MNSAHNFIKSIAKELLLLLATILLVRITSGVYAFVVALWGVCAAFKGNVGRTFACLITLTLLVLLNPFLLPAKGSVFSIAARGGTFAIGLCATATSVIRRGKYRLPLSLLWVYLCVAAISSATGWYPAISYMKLLQFSVFLLTIVIGTQNMQNKYDDINLMRSYFGAVSLFIVLGSVVMLPFPQWSTLGALIKMRDTFGDFGAVEELVSSDLYMDQLLLCGVLFHSQALAAVCSCVFVWLLCDMVFCEMKIDFWRSTLIGLSLIVLYLTRSRTGLLAMFVGIVGAAYIGMSKLRLPQKLQVRVKGILVCGIILGIVVACVAEINDDIVSRWIRKKTDVDSDQRSAVEAFTSSRMGLIEKSMYDFKLNPLLGMGFQVEERHRYGIKGYSGSGLILSASIEKGVLPVMIIGETGVVGGIAFALFLIAFYASCSRMGLLMTSLMFTVFLATNMGEATFFSPGGPGGLEWMISCVGGYILDLKIKSNASAKLIEAIIQEEHQRW